MTQQKNLARQVLDQADHLLSASRSLDYSGISAHDSRAVKQLREVLCQLGVPGWEDNLELVLSPAEVRAPDTVEQGGEGLHRSKADLVSHNQSIEERKRKEQVARQKVLVEVLSQEGFGNRLARVYDSGNERRSCALKDVPHRHGLPGFEMVVAPDFAPLNGYHGIFITALEVFTAVLPAPGEQHEWKILKRKEYQGVEQMAEYVTLLSAGFDLG